MAIYTIVKSLNNNLVLATDQHDEELVLFGKGLVLKRKKVMNSVTLTSQRFSDLKNSTIRHRQ